ncbi:MAG: hypothetical protein RL033_156 [Pseudomonadota bacterium]
MAHCYLLCVTTGSAIDRQSNNVSLFSLVEQINLPPNTPPPPRGLLPVEIHAYFQLPDTHVSRELELRFALCAETGLETLSDVFRHRVTAPRFRVRTLGLPYPPVMGQYSLQVDVRLLSDGSTTRDGPAWQRQGAAWPIALYEIDPRPRITH